MTLLRTEALFRIRRKALTLMELVVVMTILVGLGGIVLAYLPNFLTKTHDSVTVTNISEVNKAILGFMSTNLQYPDYFDSIVGTSNSMYSKAVFAPGNQFANQSVLAVLPLQNSEGQSLLAGGIAHLMIMQDPPGSDGATFGAYIGAPLIPSTSGPPTLNTSACTTLTSSSTANVVTVTDPTYVYNTLHISPKANLTYGTNYRYVVFGLGQYCQLVGDPAYGIFEAPVSFGEHLYEQPQNAYARMLCVFCVYSDGTRCEFVGSAHPDPTGLGTATMHTQEFYQTQ